MEWCIIMLLRQGVVPSLSGKRWAAFGKKENRCFTDVTSLHAQLLSKFLCTRWQATVVYCVVEFVPTVCRSKKEMIRLLLKHPRHTLDLCHHFLGSLVWSTRFLNIF